MIKKTILLFSIAILLTICFPGCSCGTSSSSSSSGRRSGSSGTVAGMPADDFFNAARKGWDAALGN